MSQDQGSPQPKPPPQTLRAARGPSAVSPRLPPSGHGSQTPLSHLPGPVFGKSPRFCGSWTFPTAKPTPARLSQAFALVAATGTINTAAGQFLRAGQALQQQGARAGGDPLLSSLGGQPPASPRPRTHSPSPLAVSGLSWGSSPGWQTWRSPPAGLRTGSVRPSSPPQLPLQPT